MPFHQAKLTGLDRSHVCWTVCHWDPIAQSLCSIFSFFIFLFSNSCILSALPFSLLNSPSFCPETLSKGSQGKAGG